MVMILETFMALSDPLILSAIRELQRERPGQYLTYAEIAQRAQRCHTITVQRSTERLISQGHITRRGGRHVGYIYSFPDEVVSAASNTSTRESTSTA